MRKSRTAVMTVTQAFVLSCALWARAADESTVSGQVYLDANGNGKLDSGEKGLPGIRVTDSVNFVTTGEDGCYTITAAEDTEIPVKASRVVSVSWPGGKWPSGAWWRRLDDIKPGEKVNFGLRDEEQKLPFVFLHVTDCHGNGWALGKFGELVKEQFSDTGLARFCIHTGDFGADASAMAKNTRAFPLPVLVTPGNHDTVGRPPDRGKGPEFGVGTFTRSVGPIRWSFTYGGAHFVGVDWSNTTIGKTDESSEIAADFLERDLKDLPQGMRTFLFMHFPCACARFEQVVAKYKVTYIFGGHNHTHREYTFGGAPAATAINLRALGGLLGIVQKDTFDVVWYCGGCKPGNPEYHSKNCALATFQTSLFAPLEQRPSLHPVLESRHGKQSAISDKTLSSASQLLDSGQGPAHITAKIVPGDARSFGLRIGDKETVEIAYSGRLLSVAGAPVPFVLRSHEKTLDWEILVENGFLTIYANDIIRLTKPVKVDNASRVSAFADGGSAKFSRVSVWTLGHAKSGANKETR